MIYVDKLTFYTFIMANKHGYGLLDGKWLL